MRSCLGDGNKPSFKFRYNLFRFEAYVEGNALPNPFGGFVVVQREERHWRGGPGDSMSLHLTAVGFGVGVLIREDDIGDDETGAGDALLRGHEEDWAVVGRCEAGCQHCHKYRLTGNR